jgi:plasmid stabilization system protein ParE
VTRRSVRFGSTANRDLASIISVIRENAGARVAARWRRAFEERSNALAEQPFLGAVDPDLGQGRRRLVVAPYLIVYELPTAGEVSILRIVHGARDLPTLFEGPSSD